MNPGRTILAALALLGLSISTFLPALRFGLVWDDPMLIGEVSRVGSTAGTAGLFASDFRLVPDRPLGYYRPVTTTSLWMQIDGAPRGKGADLPAAMVRSLHVVNVLLHAMCTALVWLLLRRLTHREWAAWLGAALFATHPVHVEPVAFISARTDLLAALFVLGSTLCWLVARTARGGRRAVALFAGAMLSLAGALSKEQALLLPLVLVAWSILPRAGKSRGWWRENRAWLVCWLLATGIALAMRARAGVGFGTSAAASGPLAFITVGLPTLLLYVRMWFVPWPLVSYYTPHDLAPGWQSGLALVALAALVAVAVRGGFRAATLAACAFVAVFLLPVLHLTPLEGAIAADRFLYLPSAGLALLTALALASLERTHALRWSSRAVVGVAVAVGVLLSMRGLPPWSRDATFFARMVEVAPNAAVGHRGQAYLLTEQGKFAEAARCARRAIELDPDYADAHELLGAVSARQGDLATARTAFETVARLQPGRASSHANLAVLALDEGDPERALGHARRAVEVAPRSADAHFLLGTVLAMLGNMQGAAREVAVLDTLDPNRARALRQSISDPGARPVR